MRGVPFPPGFRKGDPRPPSAGRRRGTPNKVTVKLKDAIAAAVEGIGGADRLVAWIREDPVNERIFWSQIVPKVIPAQLCGEPSQPPFHRIERRIVHVFVEGLPEAGEVGGA